MMPRRGYDRASCSRGGLAPLTSPFSMPGCSSPSIMTGADKSVACREASESSGTRVRIHRRRRTKSFTDLLKHMLQTRLKFVNEAECDPLGTDPSVS